MFKLIHLQLLLHDGFFAGVIHLSEVVALLLKLFQAQFGVVGTDEQVSLSGLEVKSPMRSRM